MSVTASATIDSILKTPSAVVPRRWPIRCSGPAWRRRTHRPDSCVGHRAAMSRLSKPTPLREAWLRAFRSGLRLLRRYGVGERRATHSGRYERCGGALTWTPSEGYVAQLQHSGSMLSSYKQLSRLLTAGRPRACRRGDRLRGRHRP